jgi:NADH:ubiquinone oxidoreductase subunit E
MEQVVSIENEETRQKVKEIAERYREHRTMLVGLLQDIMEAFGYLPEDVVRMIAEELDVPLGRLYELATFYSNFRLEPIGKNHVCVCMGTACHVRGAPQVLDTLERDLGIQAGETSEDLQYTLETVNCLGACALGPLVTVNEEYYGKLDQKKTKKLVKDIKSGKLTQEE